MKKAFFISYYLIIPLLIIGISFRFTFFPLTLLALFVLLLLSNRHTVGVFFLMYGGPLGGIIRTMYPFLPIYGILLELLGIILIRDLIGDLVRYNKRGVIGMLFVMAFFGFFYLLGPQDEWSKNKYTTMCLHGLLMVFGYFAFDRSIKIQAENLTRILLLGVLCMFSFCIDYYHLSPGRVFDYNWYRDQYMSFFYEQGGENMLVNYQHIGMLALFGVTIYLSQAQISRRLSIFYSLCALQMVMMSGCRQAILGLILVIAMRIAVFHKSSVQKKSIRRFMWFIAGLCISSFVLFFLIEYSSSNVLTETILEGDSGRQLLYLKTIDIINSNIFWGTGIGGFHAITGEGWPHNFILELLCETGFLGTIVLFIFLIIVIKNNKISLLHVTRTGLFYFLMLSALFVRVMVSSDLKESIELFSAIFAIVAIKKGFATSKI